MTNLREWITWHKGGLANDQLPHNSGEIRVVVWHWIWFAPLCNRRNRKRHDWTIESKRHCGLKEFVILQKTLPPRLPNRVNLRKAGMPR